MPRAAASRKVHSAPKVGTISRTAIRKAVAAAMLCTFRPDDTDCPHCGCGDLMYDVIDTDGGNKDVVDCPACKRRLWQED